jgi:hypothetical protein
MNIFTDKLTLEDIMAVVQNKPELLVDVGKLRDHLIYHGPMTLIDILEWQDSKTNKLNRLLSECLDILEEYDRDSDLIERVRKELSISSKVDN